MNSANEQKWNKSHDNLENSNCFVMLTNLQTHPVTNDNITYSKPVRPASKKELIKLNKNMRLIHALLNISLKLADAKINDNKTKLQ